MLEQQVTSFFLGANSARGFSSLYDQLIREEAGEFLWCIKGGPGCGKSSFMKRLGRAAETAGLDVEYIYCSGDPESLDAVHFPQLGIAYADATAPHVLEPRYPAASGLYLDLGAFYAAGPLEERLPEMTALQRQYRSIYQGVYAALGAAEALMPQALPGLYTAEEAAAVAARARAAIARECGKGNGAPGRLRRRFVSAISCQGTVFLGETVARLCPRLFLLDNGCGLADVYLQEAAKTAEERGQAGILCMEPLCPARAEALLLPELGVGYLAGNGRHDAGLPIHRRIRLDAMTDAARIRELRPRLRERSRAAAALLREAETLLAQAKILHDSLESWYNPHVDFSGVYSLADEHAAWLLDQAGV